MGTDGDIVYNAPAKAKIGENVGGDEAPETVALADTRGGFEPQDDHNT